MAGLRRLAVALLLLLSAGNSLAGRNKNTKQNKSNNGPTTTMAPPKKPPVDPQQLKNLVKSLLQRYEPTVNGRPVMFAMAVSIPYDKRGHFDLGEVRDEVKHVEKIEKCSVYSSKDLVAATVLKYENVFKQCPNEPVEWAGLLRGCAKVRTWAEFKSNCPADVRKKNVDDMSKINGLVDHGEYRVLQNIDKLVHRQDKKGLLLFYSHASPCSEKCTNPDYQYHILDAIDVIKKWKSYAFVFSEPFKPARAEIDEQTLQKNVATALTNLGRKIHLSNIFRCVKDNNGVISMCQSCYHKGQVSKFCIGAEG